MEAAEERSNIVSNTPKIKNIIYDKIPELLKFLIY
jgi:hypothetical protein